MLLFSAHTVFSRLLPVKWLGHIQDPRSPVNSKETLGGLIGPWPADLVGYRHLFVIV